jgi:DNA repair protein RadC
MRSTMKVYELSIKYSLVEEGPVETLSNAQTVVEYMRNAFDELPLGETFYVILLNRKNRPIGRHKVTTGTATAALCHPREVFRIAVLGTACSIIACHNHPSGIPEPSAADLSITKLLVEAGRCLEIPVLDHIIIGDATDDPLGKGYFSWRESGLM